MVEFTTDICHLLGVDNVMADTLSGLPSVASLHSTRDQTATSLQPHGGPDRCQPTLHVSPVSPSSELLDYVSNAKNQLTCPSTRIAEASYSLRLVHINVRGHQLLCDVSRGDQRPLIPEVDRKWLFQAFHELSLPGILATCRLMSAPVIWRGMS